MKYQIRLLDQNLPRLAREIAKACWYATDGIVRNALDNALYRDLFRGVRDVFRKHVEAYRYCNAARVCEASIPRGRASLLPNHERYAGEHVHVYLLGAETYPNLIKRDIVRLAVKAVADHFPGEHLHGLAAALRHAVEKVFEPHVFRSTRCGEDLLCHANVAYDPWDLRDPINRICAS